MEPVPDPTVTGTWSGSSQGVTLNLVLSQTGAAVAGSGNLSSSTNQQFALTVQSGTHVFPNLSLTMGASGVEDVNLTGPVTATTIAATLNGSGFNNFNMTLTKQ